MSDSSNVWDAGDAATDVSGTAKTDGVTALGPQTNELPPVADMFMATIEDFKVNWKAHGMTGLAMLVPVLCGSVFVVFGYFAFLIAIVNEMVVVGLVAFVGMMIVAVALTLVMGPLTFAMFSVQNSHLEGDPDSLGFGSFYSRVSENPIGAIGYQLAAGGLGFVGLLFFIIGAFIVQIALSLAIPAMVVHRMGVIAAITRSASHVKEHFVWHLGFWGLGFVVMAIAGNVPLVGYAFGMPFFASYMLRGYRAIFGGMDSEFAS